ncbi:MAG TPA: DUF1028 domain-containing protein [Candidatus Dormibacteraeota bacterium]|nr:DUF1028 domain-containing protein [Candidatus Dormibacteraeota bacterium]
MTYSIVARDPETGELGVAVQSHYFQVGPVVPWGLAGVGAVATQSMVNVSFGPAGVELMGLGYDAEHALAAVLAGDPDRDGRQCAMVDARGRVAAHTGPRCIAEAGHRLGNGFSVQANLMERATVWDAMAAAFEAAEGPLAERMLAALDAAEAEGGDVRGKQSAAMVVLTGQPTGRSWEDRTIDLRVEDHAEPVVELRRLLRYRRAYQAAAPGDVAGHRRALEIAPEVVQLRFFAGLTLAGAGEWEEGLALMRQAIASEPRWEQALPRFVPAGRLSAELAAEVATRLRAVAQQTGG